MPLTTVYRVRNWVAKTPRIPLAVFFLVALLVAGCGFDPTSAEYDQVRYEQLQKTNCEQMASFASTKLASDNPQSYEDVLDRCQKMQALNFEEYRIAAQRARESGEWELDPTLLTENQ